MKRVLMVCFLCAALVVAYAFAACAADAPAGPLEMNKTKQPVKFNHATHAKEDCKFCHHKEDGSKPFQKCPSAGCHDSFDKKDKTEKSYYKIMHGKHQTIPTCVSCHKDAAGGDKEKQKQMAGCKKSVCHP